MLREAADFGLHRASVMEGENAMTESLVLTEKFTRRDYMRTPEGFPADLIDGCFVRKPMPSLRHQRVLMQIVMRLHDVAGPRRALPGLLDVPVDDWNVLQCDGLVTRPDDPVGPETTTGKTPLLVVEVLGPKTQRLDREIKTPIYLRAGVREVWLVDPDVGTVEVHTPDSVERYLGEGRAVSKALPGLTLAWDDLAT